MICPTRKRTLAREWKRLYAEKDREKSPAIALTYETPIARIEAEFAREDEHPRDWVTNEPEGEPVVKESLTTDEDRPNPPMTEQDRKNLEHWLKQNVKI